MAEGSLTRQKARALKMEADEVVDTQDEEKPFCLSPTRTPQRHEDVAPWCHLHRKQGILKP